MLNMVPGCSCSLMTRVVSRTTKRMREMISCWLVSNTHSIDVDTSMRKTTRWLRTVPYSAERGKGCAGRAPM